MTTITEDRVERPVQEPGWPGTTALLIGAPLLMAVARLLLVPYDDQDWNGTFDDMAAHQGRSDTGWLLAMVACALLATSVVVLARQLRLAGHPRTAAVAVVSTALGWAGCAGICMGGLFMSVAAKAPDRAVQVTIQDDLTAGHTGFVFGLCVLAAVGYLVLAVSLARAGIVSKGAAVLIGLGGAATLLTMPGPLTPLLVGVALLLLAGHWLVLRAVR